jgi:hypothetical protein
VCPLAQVREVAAEAGDSLSPDDRPPHRLDATGRHGRQEAFHHLPLLAAVDLGARPAGCGVCPRAMGNLPDGGRGGRICPASRALSSSTSIRLPASTLRYKPAKASSPAGICPAGTPTVSSTARIASAAATGRPEGSKPRRSTYNCLSGNRPAT